MTGADLKRIRVQQHMTQRDICRATEMDPARICKIERGDSDKTFQKIEKILLAYGFAIVRTFPEKTTWDDFEE